MARSAERRGTSHDLQEPFCGGHRAVAASNWRLLCQLCARWHVVLLRSNDCSACADGECRTEG